MMTCRALTCDLAAIVERDVDDVSGPERAASLQPVDLVLAEEELDAARVLRDHFVLAPEHLVQVEPQPIDARCRARANEAWRTRTVRTTGAAPSTECTRR